MVIFVNIATLFVVGSLLGYGIEILFRRFITQKKWVNPGFMVGPYLPIYGFGVCILYGIWNIPVPVISNFPTWAAIIIKLLIIGVTMTLLELVAGSIFLYVFHLRLWDYRDRKWNYKGLICPLFSLIWMIIGGLYYFLLNKPFINLINMINANIIYDFFIGVGVGMMIVDACYSLKIGVKLRKALKDVKVNYTNFKEEFKKEHGLSPKKSSIAILASSKTEDLRKFIEKSRKKIEIKFRKYPNKHIRNKKK